MKRIILLLIFILGIVFLFGCTEKNTRTFDLNSGQALKITVFNKTNSDADDIHLVFAIRQAEFYSDKSNCVGSLWKDKATVKTETKADILGGYSTIRFDLKASEGEPVVKPGASQDFYIVFDLLNNDQDYHKMHGSTQFIFVGWAAHWTTHKGIGEEDPGKVIEEGINVDDVKLEPISKEDYNEMIDALYSERGEKLK